MKNDTDLTQKIYDAIQELRSEIRSTYVTKDEFAPVKAIAFGLAGIILTTVIGYLLTGVVKAR